MVKTLSKGLNCIPGRDAQNQRDVSVVCRLLHMVYSTSRSVMNLQLLFHFDKLRE